MSEVKKEATYIGGADKGAWHHTTTVYLFRLSEAMVLKLPPNCKRKDKLVSMYLAVSSSPGNKKVPANTIAQSSTQTGKFPSPDFAWVQARLPGEFRYLDVLNELGLTLTNPQDLPSHVR